MRGFGWKCIDGAHSRFVFVVDKYLPFYKVQSAVFPVYPWVLWNDLLFIKEPARLLHKLARDGKQ